MVMDKITGQFGAIYLLNTASPVAVVDDPMNATLKLPGDDTQYGAGIYFAVGDRSHKVFDKGTPVSVKNGAVVVPTTNYTVHHQKGYVEFYQPITPTGGVNDVQTFTITGTPTAGGVAISYGGVSVTIPYNSTLVAAQALLDAAYGAGNVTASGGPWPGTPFVFTGTGTLASTFIATAVLNSTLNAGATVAVVHTTSGTSGIKISGSYVNTSIAANVGRVAACRDWQFSLDEADVDGTDYDAGGFGDHLSGIANGTFQFEQMEVEMSLYQKFRQAKRVLFAFYEDVRAPRLWLLTGRMRTFPRAAPVGGIVAGTIQGTISGWPDFLTEAL